MSRFNSQVQRRILIPIALVLLAAAMWPVLKASLASLYYFPAAYAVEQWQQSAEKPEAKQIEQAKSHIAAALHWQPDNPHYQLMAAKIAEWGWFSGLLSTDALSANEQIYQQAIAQRPDWPVAYADYGYFLATVQQRLTDAWLQFALAEQHGAFLPEVHEKILAVAFANWPALTVAQKAAVFRRVQTAIGGPLQAKTIKLIRQYKQQRLQCLYLRKQLTEPALRSQVVGQLCPQG